MGVLFSLVFAVNMAGFHLLGDPYFPNQQNVGWLDPEEDPEEDPKEDPKKEQEVEIEDGPAELVADLEEEELIDSNDGDSDAESEVIHPPYLVRVSAHRLGPNGPTPPWGHDIWSWSRKQGQRPPFSMARRLYALSDGGPAD